MACEGEGLVEVEDGELDGRERLLLLAEVGELGRPPVEEQSCAKSQAAVPWSLANPFACTSLSTDATMSAIPAPLPSNGSSWSKRSARGTGSTGLVAAIDE